MEYTAGRLGFFMGRGVGLVVLASIYGIFPNAAQ
jgi:hypothetical protein